MTEQPPPPRGDQPSGGSSPYPGDQGRTDHGPWAEPTTPLPSGEVERWGGDPYTAEPYTAEPYASEPYAHPGGSPAYGATPYPQPSQPPYQQPYQQPYRPSAGTPMMAPRKEPAISLLISFFVPGVGSMINGDTGIGIGILVGYLISWVFFSCGFLFIIGFLGIPAAIGFFIWGLVDAYQGALRHNRRLGYPG